jgi:hypothetical protein
MHKMRLKIKKKDRALCKKYSDNIVDKSKTTMYKNGEELTEIEYKVKMRYSSVGSE